MAKVNVEIEGFEELQNIITKLKLTPEVRGNALKAGGEHMQAEIAKATPVGDTGKLQESIAVGEVSADGKVLIGPSQQGPDYRAHFPEFGTSKMKAQPYMRPTYEREINNVQKIMAEEVKKEMGL